MSVTRTWTRPILGTQLWLSWNRPRLPFWKARRLLPGGSRVQTERVRSSGSSPLPRGQGRGTEPSEGLGLLLRFPGISSTLEVPSAPEISLASAVECDAGSKLTAATLPSVSGGWTLVKTLRPAPPKGAGGGSDRTLGVRCQGTGVLSVGGGLQNNFSVPSQLLGLFPALRGLSFVFS